MRVARPTDNLAAIAEMYARGLGFDVLAAFKDHRGFDGVIVGHPKQAYHIEFTSQRGHEVGKAPSQDHLLVFYVPDKDEWDASCAQMISAGFREVPHADNISPPGHRTLQFEFPIFFERWFPRAIGIFLAQERARWRAGGRAARGGPSA